MKRVTIIAMMFAVFSLSAQQPAENSPTIAIPLSEAENASLQNDLKRRASQRAAAKTNGTEYLSQRMAHYDIASLQFGNLLKPVYTPVAPDSTYIQELKGIDNINVHGFGQVFDPASAGFMVIGQPHFSKYDAYEVDTIYIGVRYRTSALTSGYTGDTLRVDIFYGTHTDNGVWNVGIGYPANTFPNQTQRIDVATPRYLGHSAIGSPGNITASGKLEIKYAFKDIDTTVNFIKVVPPSPIQMAAGEKFGVFCDFMPGQSYDGATQRYYVSGGKGDVNNLSWLYLTATNEVDNTPYFLETLQIGSPSSGLSHILDSKTRYASWTGIDAFRNHYVPPVTLSGNLMDVWVSGITTVGQDEATQSELGLYPNPGDGLVQISTHMAGKQKLEVRTITGAHVYAEELSLSGQNTIQKDFTHLPEGIYLITLSDGQSQHTSRLIIQ